MAVGTLEQYIRLESESYGCLFCGGGRDYGPNGAGEWACTKCRPFYSKDLREGRLPPRVAETGTPFDFHRWALLRRAEADAAEAGYTTEQTRALVMGIVDYWVQSHLFTMKRIQEEEAEADAERAAMSSRYSY